MIESATRYSFCITTVLISMIVTLWHFLSSPNMNTFNLLCYRHGGGPQIHLIHSLTGDICWLPPQQYNLLQVLNCVVLDTDKTESIDHAVAHGNALNDVKSHQWVLLAGNECWVKISQDGVAIIWCPAQDVCRQDPDQDHHCFAATSQSLSYLLCLETWDILEPKLAGNSGVTHSHDSHRANKLHSENKQKVRTVIGLLVHRPDLSTEDFVGAWGAKMRVHGLWGKIGGGNWYQNGNNPDTCYQAVGSLVLHTRPQRMDYSHVPERKKINILLQWGDCESIISCLAVWVLNRYGKLLSLS